jgi:tetratricopeptide (TPR) repeat protein
VLGQIEYTALDLPIGLTHLQTAARLEPNDPGIQFTAGRADARRGKYEEAKRKFRCAITLDGTTIYDVIDLYTREMDRPELAIDVASDDDYRMFQVAAELQKIPKYKDLAHKAYEMGTALLDKKCQEPGVRAFDYANLANRYSYLGNDAAAEKYFVKALELDYSNAVWRTQHAEALYRLGRVTEAIEEAQRAVRQHPEFEEGKRVLEMVSKPIAPR